MTPSTPCAGPATSRICCWRTGRYRCSGEYVRGVSQYAELDWPPAIEYQDISRVGVYCLADRARHQAGALIATTRITYAR